MQYPRYGYRRINIFLAREGQEMSMGRAWRLWNQAGLQVPRKRPRRRVAALRPRPLAPSQANQVWSYDFVFDSCANGQQLKCLTLIDEYTRECLAIDVAGSIRSDRDYYTVRKSRLLHTVELLNEKILLLTTSLFRGYYPAARSGRGDVDKRWPCREPERKH